MVTDEALYKITYQTNGQTLLPQMATSLDRVDDKTNQVGSSANRSFSLFNNRAGKINSLLNQTKSLLVGIGLTMSVGSFATGLVSTGARFEKSMSRVNALTSATTQELTLMKAAARESGATTAYSASQSAEAMGYLAQAGFKTNQIVAALPHSLSLAAAGNLELSRSADIATNVLTQYRMKASETNVVVDQMAFVQGNFNTNIEEMADAMNYFGPTANAFNISLAESSTTIGLLASGGLKGSLGTRALGTSLTRLANPTKKMTGLMNKLGLEFFNAEGRFIGMAGTIGLLEEKTTSMTDKQRQQTLSVLFGAEAIQEWNILLNAGSSEIERWTREVENADGAARRMADTQLDNLAGDFQLLKSVSEDFTLTLYDGVQPSLRAITKEATLFIQNMDTQRVTQGLQQFVNTLYKGAVWVRQHWGLIVNIGKAYVSLRVGILAANMATSLFTAGTALYGSAMTLFAAKTATATAATAGLGTAVTALTGPIGIVIGLLGAAATAAILYKKNNDQATESVNNLSLAEAQAKMERQQNKAMLSATELDEAKLAEGKLTQAQYNSLLSGAQMRKQRAEDLILSAKIEARKSKEWVKVEEQQSIIRNPEASDYEKGVARSRLKYFSEKLESNMSERMGISFSQMQKMVNANASLIKSVKPLVDEQTNGRGSTTLDSITGEMNQNVVSGGARSVVYNVTVEKMADIVFEIKEGIEEVADKYPEIEDELKSLLARVLTPSRALING